MELTVREAAELSGVPPRRIEKAAEEGVVTKRKTVGTLRRGRAAYVPAHTVAYVSVLKHLNGLSLNIAMKRRLFKLIKSHQGALGVVELSPGFRVALNDLAADEWSKTLAYVAAKSKHLESRDDIFGGDPVIRGTRITCRSVLGRLSNGDTLDDLCEDYPDIPREAFDAAATYARTHPVRGRPAAGKPWRQ